jgi:hypothetical protein
VDVPPFKPFMVAVLLPLEPVVFPIDATSVSLEITLSKVTELSLLSQVI